MGVLPGESGGFKITAPDVLEYLGVRPDHGDYKALTGINPDNIPGCKGG
jgi:hypothetical protein